MAEITLTFSSVKDFTAFLESMGADPNGRPYWRDPVDGCAHELVDDDPDPAEESDEYIADDLRRRLGEGLLSGPAGR